MDYKIADGHDNTAGLTLISVQPYCPPIEYPRIVRAVSQKVYEDGYPFTWFRYGNLQVAQYTSLLTEFGLASATYNNVTVTLPGNDRVAVNYNARIIHVKSKEYRDFANHIYTYAYFKLITLDAI